MPRRNAVDAARPQIEQHVLVHRPGRAAVGALDVIGVNLQRGLAVHGRVVAQQQRLAGLLRVRLLRELADEDFAFEHAAGFVGQHVLVQLVAGAIGGGVVEQRVIVAVLLAAEDDQPVERRLGVLAGEDAVQIVARHASAERRGLADDAGVAREVHLERRDVEGLRRFLLVTIDVDAAVVGGDDFGHAVRPVHAARPDEALNQRQLGVLFGDD